MITQEVLNAMMRNPSEHRPAPAPLPVCPQCGEKYCGDGVALCLECQHKERKDKERLDWLADVDNKLGGITDNG